MVLSVFRNQDEHRRQEDFKILRYLWVYMYLPEQDVRTYYKNATMGKYHDLEDEAEGKMPQMNTDTLNLCKLGKIMKDRYAEYRTNIMAETIPLTDDEYLQGLLRKVGEAVDGRLDE